MNGIKRLRLGIVGAGLRAQGFVDTIAALHEQYELVAVCDVIEAAARGIAERAGARAHADYLEFLAKEQLDVVVIATPAESHHLFAKVAAEHGVHMLIETPLAPT